MFDYASLRYLAVPLPEDLQRLKDYGDFARLERVIDLRLAAPIPDALRARLALEKEILRTLPGQYPYGEAEALSLAQQTFRDFTADELSALRDENAVDWIYVSGQPHLKDDFLATLVKVRPALAARAFDQRPVAARAQSQAELDAIVAEMKQHGAARRRIRMSHTLRLVPGAEHPGETVRVHLPLPIPYAQVKNVRVLSLTPACGSAGPEDAPLRTAYFEKPCEPGDVFRAEYEFEIHARYTEPKPEEALSAQPRFYLEQEEPHIVFTPFLRLLAEEIVGGETNPVRKARRVYDYLTTRVIYSFVRSYFDITNLPEYMLLSGKGDCGLYALSFITLCRLAGVPARWQSGMEAAPDGAGSHDWAQFYIAPYGWLYADCSFGGAAYRAGNLERWNFYFGNLDPYRMPAASAFQRPLTPPTRFLPHDPYDNQTGEIEFESGPVNRANVQIERKVLKIERV